MSDDAKVLTPAEAECLPEHGDEDGGMPGVVLVDRDDLLATTRALETAQMAETKAAAAAMREWDSLKHEFESSVATLRARAEKAESERDEVAVRLGVECANVLAAQARAAELEAALVGLERRFLDPRPGNPGGPCWCSEERPRWMDHEGACDAARAALAKAKGGAS